MNKLLWEVKTIVCDLCKERPIKKTIELTRGRFVGICQECEPKEKEIKNERT